MCTYVVEGIVQIFVAVTHGRGEMYVPFFSTFGSDKNKKFRLCV